MSTVTVSFSPCFSSIYQHSLAEGKDWDALGNVFGSWRESWYCYEQGIAGKGLEALKGNCIGYG